MGTIKSNAGSLVRLGLGWAGGYFAAKGVDINVAGLEEVVSAAILLFAAVWAWWKNRKGAQK